MVLLLLSLVRADTSDSGDTAPYEDTDAQVELVYRQEEGGCGGDKGAWLLLPLLGLFALPKRRDA